MPQMKTTILENWKQSCNAKLQHDILCTKSLMVPIVAELTVRRIPYLCGKTSTGIINDSYRTTALEENDTRCKRDVRHAALRSHYLARLLFAVQLSSLEIAVLALVMDICHGGDTRYRALPPTKKHRGEIIDDARARNGNGRSNIHDADISWCI